MYDTADKHGSTKGNKVGDKRFAAVDPVKGDVRNPQSLVQYTYVLNHPLMYVDPLGLWTVGLGGDIALALGGRLDGGAELVIDSKGNIGILFYGSAGGGTPTSSAGFHGTVTPAAESIYDILGSSYVVGGSVPLVGAEVIQSIGNISGKELIGYGLSGGVKLPELHRTMSNSKPAIIINVPQAAKSIVQKVVDYFNSLSCEQQQYVLDVLAQLQQGY